MQQTENSKSANELLRGPPGNPCPTNDNSNPQQGTGSNLKDDTKGTAAAAKNPAASTSKDKTNTAKAPSSSASSGQGAAKAARHSAKASAEKQLGISQSKIPPTKKDSRKLFVGGLPPDVTQAEFKTFFAQFGELLDAVVMFDRESHRSRGFGFVTYVDQDVSNKLLQMTVSVEGQAKEEEEALPTIVNGQQVGRLNMRGKICEVKSAQPKQAGSIAPPRRFNKNSRASKAPSQSAAPVAVAPNMTMQHVYPIPPVDVAPAPVPPQIPGIEYLPPHMLQGYVPTYYPHFSTSVPPGNGVPVPMAPAYAHPGVAPALPPFSNAHMNGVGAVYPVPPPHPPAPFAHSGVPEMIPPTFHHAPPPPPQAVPNAGAAMMMPAPMPAQPNPIVGGIGEYHNHVPNVQSNSGMMGGGYQDKKGTE